MRLAKSIIATGFFLAGVTNVFAVVDENSANANNQAVEVNTSQYASNRIIVRFKDNIGITSFDTQALHAQVGAQVLAQYPRLNGIQVIQANNMSVEDLVQTYRNNPNVLYAEPDYEVRIALAPDDPRYPEMWGLDNTGQSSGTVDADINAPEAWDLTTGDENVIVAVIDTGIDYNHPDLIGNLWVNPNEIPGDGVDDDGNGYVDDIFGINAINDTGDPLDGNGHGTHVAGTIGATGNNSLGVVGVNWNVKIISCKFLSDAGRGSSSDALKCLSYLLDLKTMAGINIVLSNNSWGGGGFSTSLRDAIMAHQDQDILFVSSAGNSGVNTDFSPAYPASYDLPGIISVASTDRNDDISSFSNYGRATVDVGAPGSAILSTFPLGGTCTLCTVGNQYDSLGYGVISGTSMASPHVSGLAALLKAQDPTRTGSEIKNIILTSGTPLSVLDDNTVSGKRIRAFDTGGVGALTCSDQSLVRRTSPGANAVSVLPGDAITLQYVSLNCDSIVNGSYSVTTQPDGLTINLLDDGVPPDLVANDGYYTSQYTVTQEGSVTFPGNDIVEIEFFENYQDPIVVPYQGRPVASADIGINFSSYGASALAFRIPTFFPIEFGNRLPGHERILWGSQANLSFDNLIFSANNTALPQSFFQTQILPYWDNLNPMNNTNSIGYVDVQGVAPDRELIIGYQNFPHQTITTDALRLQVVFFESNSDVLFNYVNTEFGDVTIDDGASATIGLQVDPTLFRQYSFDSPSVTSSMSLLWQVERVEPNANAGRSQRVNFGDTVQLDGSASTDGQTSIATYLWEQVNGTTVTLSNADQVIASLTAPATPGSMVFNLTVTDTDGNTDTDSATVTINTPPTANAGNNQVANFGDAITLTSLSSDIDGTIVSHNWSQSGGTAVSLNNAATTTADFIAGSSPETLTFDLTVVDNEGASDTNSVDVRINNPPTADAGPFQIVAYASTVNLDGSASADTDSAIATYSWTQVAGTTVTLSGNNVVSPTFTVANNSEILTFELVVTDIDGATSSISSVNVQVNDIPVADAGTRQIVNIGDSVTLTGSGTDSDGTVDAYLWSQASGTTVSLTNSDMAISSFVAPNSGGSLFFDLVVTDNDGVNSVASSVETYVNNPPSVTVGTAQTVTEGATVNISGSATDTDGTVTSYAWSQSSGPSATLSAATSASASFIASTPGTYVFQLTATDNDGGSSSNSITITVNKKKQKSGGAINLTALGMLSLLMLATRRRRKLK